MRQKESLQKYGEEYRDANRDKQKEYDKNRYEQNKEEIKLRQREYYKTHPRPKVVSVKKYYTYYNDIEFINDYDFPKLLSI